VSVGARVWPTLTVPPPGVALEEADIVRSYLHDAGAFTQGLLIRHGRMFESTGLEGLSTIREVRLEDGRVLRSAALPPTDFRRGARRLGEADHQPDLALGERLPLGF
jgi:glutamine cyclotransferase